MNHSNINDLLQSVGFSYTKAHRMFVDNLRETEDNRESFKYMKQFVNNYRPSLIKNSPEIETTIVSKESSSTVKYFETVFKLTGSVKQEQQPPIVDFLNKLIRICAQIKPNLIIVHGSEILRCLNLENTVSDVDIITSDRSVCFGLALMLSIYERKHVFQLRTIPHIPGLIRIFRRKEVTTSREEDALADIMTIDPASFYFHHKNLTHMPTKNIPYQHQYSWIAFSNLLEGLCFPVRFKKIMNNAKYIGRIKYWLDAYYNFRQNQTEVLSLTIQHGLQYIATIKLDEQYQVQIHNESTDDFLSRENSTLTRIPLVVALTNCLGFVEARKDGMTIHLNINGRYIFNPKHSELYQANILAVIMKSFICLNKMDMVIKIVNTIISLLQSEVVFDASSIVKTGNFQQYLGYETMGLFSKHNPRIFETVYHSIGWLQALPQLTPIRADEQMSRYNPRYTQRYRYYAR